MGTRCGKMLPRAAENHDLYRLRNKNFGLKTLAAEFEKKSVSFDPGIVPKIGTTLVRQWRGHAHTVLVREDGLVYEGQHYRSLTVIAERITGAHWSGPRFFGLTKRTGASLGAKAGQ